MEDEAQWDVRMDWETVQRWVRPSQVTSWAPQHSSRSSERNIVLLCRLLAQLRDMESAFDGFFEKHRLKLHQYQQLLKYEKSFQEVSMAFLLSPPYCSCGMCFHLQRFKKIRS